MTTSRKVALLNSMTAVVCSELSACKPPPSEGINKEGGVVVFFVNECFLMTCHQITPISLFHCKWCKFVCFTLGVINPSLLAFKISWLFLEICQQVLSCLQPDSAVYVGKMWPYSCWRITIKDRLSLQNPRKEADSCRLLSHCYSCWLPQGTFLLIRGYLAK